MAKIELTNGDIVRVKENTGQIRPNMGFPSISLTVIENISGNKHNEVKEFFCTNHIIRFRDE